MKIKHLLVLSALSIVSTSGFAAIATDTLPVSGTVGSACSFTNSGSDTIPFGTLINTAGILTENNITQSIAITCAGSYSVYGDYGLNSTAAAGLTPVTNRALVNGGTNYIAYDLYTATPTSSANVLEPYGTPSMLSTNYLTGTASAPVSIYAQVPTQTPVGLVDAGTYTDTVTLSMYY